MIPFAIMQNRTETAKLANVKSGAERVFESLSHDEKILVCGDTVLETMSDLVYEAVLPDTGFIDVYKSSDGGNSASIWIGVNPKNRNKGVSHILVDTAKAACSGLGFEKLVWYCHESNLASYKSALSNGFSETERASCDRTLEYEFPKTSGQSES